MTIKPVDSHDWQQFYHWAETENWLVSFQEKRLFQNQWRPYFYVLWEGGQRRGYISAVVYSSSAWIGNLIVDPQLRQRGYGTRLFEFALKRLRTISTLNRIWLTASEQGAPLYCKYGFTAVDRVERWVARGKAGEEEQTDLVLAALISLDCDCWGESRKSLLTLLADDSCLVAADGSMALLQTGIDFWQLGPWLSGNHSSSDLRRCLDQALTLAPEGRIVVSDILASSGTSLVLKKAGFKRSASNELMCLSEEPVNISGVISLASLGSIG